MDRRIRQLMIAALLLLFAQQAGGAAPVGDGVESRPLGVVSPDVTDDAAARSIVGESFRVGVALTIVIGLVFGLRWIATRIGHSGPGTATRGDLVDILARYPAGRGQQFLLMRVGPRVLLIHAGGGDMTTLTTFDDPLEVEGLLDSLATRRPSSFETLLTRHRAGAIVDLTRSRRGGAS